MLTLTPHLLDTPPTVDALAADLLAEMESHHPWSEGDDCELTLVVGTSRLATLAPSRWTVFSQRSADERTAHQALPSATTTFRTGSRPTPMRARRAARRLLRRLAINHGMRTTPML